MTLVLTLASDHFVVQASDGRLSQATGRGKPSTATDKANKAILVNGEFARFSIAYTGPALLGLATGDSQPFPGTSMAIGDFLLNARAYSLRIEEIVQLLRRWLDDVLAIISRTYGLQPMTVVLAGFAKDIDGSAAPFYCEISNYFDPNSEAPLPPRRNFIDYLCFLPMGKTLFTVRGAEQAFTKRLWERLSRWREQGVFASNRIPQIEQCLSRLIRDAASTPGFGQYIGRNCVSVSIHAASGIRSVYWGENATEPLMMSPLYIQAGFAVRPLYWRGLGDLSIGGPAPSKKKQRRAPISPNRKCPCGSGRRFKHCCMTRSRLLNRTISDSPEAVAAFLASIANEPLRGR